MKLVNYWDKYTEMHGQQNVKTPIKVLPNFVELRSGTHSISGIFHDCKMCTAKSKCMITSFIIFMPWKLF